MLTIACVLKSGGDFTPEYVHNLHEGIKKNISGPYRFVCITDMFGFNGNTLNLTPGLRGWWAKIDIFRLSPPVLYFDLDTIITGSLNEFEILAEDNVHDIFMLRGPRMKKPASGIMLINSDMRFVYDDFMEDFPSSTYVEIERVLHLSIGDTTYRGDQDYITRKVKERISIHYIQDYVTGVYYYKHHCKDGLPEDATVVAFHGIPRPPDVGVPWVKDYWRKR